MPLAFTVQLSVTRPSVPAGVLTNMVLNLPTPGPEENLTVVSCPGPDFTIFKNSLKLVIEQNKLGSYVLCTFTIEKLFFVFFK